MELFESTPFFPIREDRLDRIPVFLDAIERIQANRRSCRGISCDSCPFDVRYSSTNFDLCDRDGNGDIRNFDKLRSDFLAEAQRRGFNHGII